MFWDILTEILWHKNRIGGLKNLFMHSRGDMKIWYALEGTWIKVITEHNRLNDHMFRIELSETRLCECGEAQRAAHVLMDCHLYSADREVMMGVIELSFVKCNLPIHEWTFNLSSLLWPELSINQCSHQWGAQFSDQHKSQFLDCHKWNRDHSVTICEIYHKGYHIYTGVL